MEMENTTVETVDRWLTAKRERVVEERAVEVDLYVRSLSPSLGIRQRQEQTIRQLQQLQDAGLIEEFRVTLWGGGTCLCDTCSGTAVAQSMLDGIEAFEQWAAEQGEVRLPFERKHVESSILGRTVHDLDVPSLCLSVTANSDIECVLPCTVAGEPVSVTDFLDQLADTDAVETEQVSNSDQLVQI